MPHNICSVLRAAATTGSARHGITSVSTSGEQVGHVSCLLVTHRFLLIFFTASLAERDIQLGVIKKQTNKQLEKAEENGES